METENKDLSLDTQSREELENRMIFVREEELDGVEERAIVREGTPYSVLAPENNDPKGGKHNDE